MQSVGDELVFEEVPALLDRVEFRSGDGEPFHFDGVSVGSQPTFDFLTPVGVRPIEE